MAVQILGNDGASVARVSPLHKSLSVSPRPLETRGWNSMGVQSGALTALAANAEVFQFRNASANLVVIRRLAVALAFSTAPSATVIVDLGCAVARNWTVDGSGGTTIDLTGNNGKHRVDLVTPSGMSARISTTGALTGGTKTVDATELGQIGGFVPTALPAGLIIPLTSLIEQAAGDMPVVLSPNEGVIVRNKSAFLVGAARLYVNVEYAEILAADFPA